MVTKSQAVYKVAVVDYEKCEQCLGEGDGCKLVCSFITFDHQGKPQVSAKLCAGCGDCLEDCPSRAIVLKIKEC